MAIELLLLKAAGNIFFFMRQLGVAEEAFWEYELTVDCSR